MPNLANRGKQCHTAFPKVLDQSKRLKYVWDQKGTTDSKAQAVMRHSILLQGIFRAPGLGSSDVQLADTPVYRQQAPEAQSPSSANQATATKNAGTQCHVDTGLVTLLGKALLPLADPTPKSTNRWLA